MKCQPWNFLQCPIYIINSVDNIKSPFYTLQPRQYHSFIRNFSPLWKSQLVYFLSVLVLNHNVFGSTHSLSTLALFSLSSSFLFLSFFFIIVFSLEKPDCVLCSDVKTIASRASANLTKAAFKKRFYETASPVVVRDMPGYGDTEHSFEKFMEFYHTHQAALEEDTCEFRKNGVNNESLQNIAEFLGNWKHYQPNGEIIGWLVYCRDHITFYYGLTVQLSESINM